MVYKECECGCGRVFETTRRNRKYYNEACKKRAKRQRKKAVKNVEAKSKEWNRLSPYTRWKMMTLEEVCTESLRLHLSYGKLQVMAKCGTLPQDFGKGCRKQTQKSIERKKEK